MYLSLKGSLGHTPITDRVGEGPLQIAEGAAAAYSLRNLGSDSPSVVRVRRESDNNERDFTAQDISTSVLTNWVNQQITPPLDLRELTATGRDGPIIEAAAAYSLRNLSDSYAGSVVEVRRSSDSAVRSFTAAEVTDGTLVAWVSEAPIAQNSTSKPYTTFTNASNTGFTATLSSGVAYAGFGGVSGSSGDSVTVSFDLNIVSGSPFLALRSGLTSIFSKSNNQVYSSSGSYSLTMTATENFGFIGFSEGDIPSEFTVSNFEITSVSGATYVRDGTVSKWYDQSTTSGVPNANHAVQTSAASQPKIVDGGTLVTGGLDFDGTNDSLLSTSVYSTASHISAFFLADSTGTDNRVIDTRGTGAAGTVQGWFARFSSSGGTSLVDDGSASFGTTNIIRSGKSLVTVLASQTIIEDYTNGTLSASDTGSIGSFYSSNPLTIGANSNGQNTQLFGGTIAEIIIYNSDQSDNRTALEANIGEVYGIAGIPAYDNTVNGFVETWYDQSGNGNNATQLTASKQPKIVSAGALVVGGIDFDGVNDVLDGITNMFSGTSAVSSFIVGNADSTLTSEAMFSQGANNVAGNAFVVTSEIAFRPGGNTIYDNDFINASTLLLSTIAPESSTSADVLMFLDGSAMGQISTTSATLNYGTEGAAIGRNWSGVSFYDGRLFEIIVYPSDQSANRLAIEANINNQYDIY